MATVTWQGDDLTNPTFWNDADNWDTGNVPVAGDDVVLSNAANCNVNVATAALKSLDMTGYTGTLSGTFAITVRGLTAATNVCKLAGTIAWTGTLTFSPVSTTAVINLTSNAKLITAMSITSGAAVSLVVLQDDLAFAASTTCSLTLAERGLDLNGHTISGNSATNRLLVTSNILGTSANQIITVNAGTFANADFRDVLFANGGADLDLSAITGLSGDCGGNGMSGGGTLTMTTPTTTACTGNTGVWSTRTWDVRAPLPQDTVVISLTAGQTLTTNMPRLGKDISFGTATNLTLGSVVTSYGSLNLTGMGTFGGTYAWYFESQARSGTNTLTSNGKVFPWQIYIAVVQATLQLGDAFANSSYVYHQHGTFIDAGFTMTMPAFNSNVSTTRAVAKTGNWIIGSGGPYFTLNSSVVWSDTAGAITFSTNAVNTTFAGAGKTFNNLSCPAGTGGVTITGSNTFNDITVAAGGKLVVTAGTTQTVNTFTAVGSSGNAITLASSTPGSPFTLTDANGGTNNGDWLNVTDSAGTPASTWFYGGNGTADAYSLANGWKSGSVYQIISIIQD